MPSIALADGEYFIWSSPRSRTAKITPWRALGIFFFGFYLFSVFPSLWFFLGWPWVIGCTAFVMGIVALVWWNGRRPVFFMTNKHLIDAGIFFKQKIPLASIRGCKRHVQEVRTRFGFERILTDKVQLLTGGQTVTFGPVLDFEALWELIHHAVLGNTIQISALPALDGSPAPAEKRNDVLFILSTKTEGDVYGPLLIGPTKIIRFTEKLPSLLERILLTVAAEQISAYEMEAYMLQLVKHPHARHSTVIERDMTAASIQGNELALTTPERVIKMELRPGDVTRTAAFVRMWRPAHPMR